MSHQQEKESQRLMSVAPSHDESSSIREEARRVFYDARQDCLRYRIYHDEGIRTRAVEALNRIYLLYCESGFAPEEIGTTPVEVTTLYQSIGYFLISNSFMYFFHLQKE